MTDLNQDLAALDAALYMGPTHGPWHATKPESHGTGVRGPAQVSLAWCGCATTVGEEGCYSIGAAEATANAHFIAACSPDRIRRLLGYIRKLEQEVANGNGLHVGDAAGDAARSQMAHGHVGRNQAAARTTSMTDHKFRQLLAGVTVGALPDEVRDLVGFLIEGRVKQLVFAAELDDCQVLDAIFTQDKRCNRYVMVGALEVLKRDYMRSEIQSRIEYVEADGDD